MATARDDPRWNSFLPSENSRRTVSIEALRDAQRHPKDWTDGLSKGWGGVKSKKSHMARAMAPVLQKMLIMDGKGNLPDGCIDFKLGMKESQGIQKECRVLETRRRLEERASQRLKNQKKDLIQILDSCSTNVLKIDEFQKQYNKSQDQSASSRDRLMQTVAWLDEVMTVQAQYLLSKYIGINIPPVDPRMESMQPKMQNESVFSPDIPLLNTASNVSYAARRAGISTRGSFLTVSDYVKQYTKAKDKLDINQYPLIETSINSTGFKTREMHKSIKAPRKYENPHYCLWSRVKTAALIPFFPDSIQELICVTESDSDGNNTTWWKRFKKFWYHQDSLAMQDRDHETAILFMEEWSQLDIDYILSMENALSESPGKRPYSVSESNLVEGEENMTDLFHDSYGSVSIEELSITEMEKMIKRVTSQLKSRCEEQGDGCLDNPSKTFVREFLGMSKLSNENSLNMIPRFDNLPPLPILMAEAVPVNHRVLEDSPKKTSLKEPVLVQTDITTSSSSSSSSSSGNEDDKDLQNTPCSDVTMIDSAEELNSSHESPMLIQTHLVLNHGSLNTSSSQGSSVKIPDVSPEELAETESSKKNSLETSLETLLSKKIIEPGDAVAIRMFLKHAEIMLKLKTEKGDELTCQRLTWALSRCWALITFLCSVTNSNYQNSKKEGTGTELITRYEAVRSVLNRHFSSPDLRVILSAAGTGKEDEVIYGNTIHKASWPADFPLMNLKQAKSLGPCSSSMSFGLEDSNNKTNTNTTSYASAVVIEVEAPWDYTVGGWLCIRCMQKLKERWGDCRCQCFRGHKRRQCMGPMSHCYGFHPNRLMEYLALGLQTRYNDGRGPGDAYFNRTWAGRQRWRRWRMCIKDIVLNGDSWFGVVPKNQQHLGYTGLSTDLKELTRDWLERIDWSHYSLWNKKTRRYNLFAMNVARLDMLVGCGSWLRTPPPPPPPPSETRTTKKKKRVRNHKKAVWSSISGRCAMCGQDLIVNKNNTSRGLCVGCRAWKSVTNVETKLISNIESYRFFNTKTSSLAEMDQDCVRRFFGLDNQFVQGRPILCLDSAALGIAMPAFSSDGILAHVKNRMRNLLYPDQEVEEKKDDVQLGHWHEGIYYPHHSEKESESESMKKQLLYKAGSAVLLPSQEEQEVMLHGIWEEVRIEICCWSEASFEDLLKTSSWDSESIALAREWRRVWHNIIKCFQNKNTIQKFRETMIKVFSLHDSQQDESSLMLLVSLPSQLIPKKLAVFGTIKPMSKMSQCKEMMYMKRQDQINISSKSCLSRLMQWWPRPVINMVNRWLRWKDDLILFQKVRRNFAKKTVALAPPRSSSPKKKRKIKEAPPPPPPVIKEASAVLLIPPVSSSLVVKTERPKLSFSARWCLKLPEAQNSTSRKRKRRK